MVQTEAKLKGRKRECHSSDPCEKSKGLKSGIDSGEEENWNDSETLKIQ